MSTLQLHPALDNGIQPAAANFTGGTLQCLCATDKVEVKIDAQTLYNHACGCSKCWKPQNATFAVIAVVPRDKVSVIAHSEKLAIVDETATIQRHACKQCHAHLFGRIENKDHAFMAWTSSTPNFRHRADGRRRDSRRSCPPSSKPAHRQRK